MSVSLEKRVVPLFFIPVSLHPKGSVQAWVRHWDQLRDEDWHGEVQSHADEGKLQDWGYLVSKESISGNLRGALKHWKDPHLGKGKYLP